MSETIQSGASGGGAVISLHEQVAQLGSIFAFDLLEDGELSPDALDRIPAGVGQVTRLAGGTSLSRSEVASIANELQRRLLEAGLPPAIMHEECLAGFMAVDAVIHPQALGLAASWDPEIVHKIGWSIATQMRLAGAQFGLSPVLDISRDPRWGRVEETFGEDPHLTSALGLAMISGLQHRGDGSGILATAKHFVGHGTPEGGRNAASPHLGARELREVYMAPFEQAVRHGSVASIMHAYHDLDGVPCIANRELLVDVLRGEWGFDGTVVSDYNGVEELEEAHRIVDSLEAAAVLALESGLDVELPETSGFGEPLIRAAIAEDVDRSLVERAAERVLAQKTALGLFRDPFVDPARVHDEDHAAADLARVAAPGAFVMLQNRDQLLPIDPSASVAVIGPNADDPFALVGDYAHVVHQKLLEELRTVSLAGSPPIPDDLVLQPELPGLSTVADAFRAAGAAVRVEAGCALIGDDRTGFDAAVEAARQAEIAVLVMGERSGLTADCTSGESRDRTELGLPGVQQELVEAVVATGTPTVLLVLSGRPNSLRWAAEHVDAIIWGICPGQFGGEAAYDIITGRTEPRGRLPITMLRSVGQVPLHHAHNPSSATSRWRTDYVEESHLPLWPFGHGLGWSQCMVDEAVGAELVETSAEEIPLTATLRNAGDRSTSTVVQVYLEQGAASVVRPARRLVHFERVELAPQEVRTVQLDVPVGRLALINQAGDRVVEPGDVDFAIGLSSADIHVRHRLRIDGADHPVIVPPPAWSAASE